MLSAVVTSSSPWRSYEISASTLMLSWQLSSTQVELSAAVSSSWGDCVKSAVMLAKKSLNVWSADSTTATLHLQVCSSRPSDRCSVYRTLLLGSLLTHSQEITSPQFLMRLHWLPIKSRTTQTVPPDAPWSHQRTWLRWFNLLQHTHRDGRDLASRLPVTSCTGRRHCKSSSVSELSAMLALLPGTVCHTVHKVWVKH